MVFWKPEVWENQRRSGRTIRYYRYYASRFEDHVFRTKHKFQQHKIAPKSLSPAKAHKKEWRETSGMNKDKAKSHHRYQRHTHQDRILAHRRERRKVRTSLHSGDEVDNKIKKNIGDYWD